MVYCLSHIYGTLRTLKFTMRTLLTTIKRALKRTLEVICCDDASISSQKICNNFLSEWVNGDFLSFRRPVVYLRQSCGLIIDLVGDASSKQLPRTRTSRRSMKPTQVTASQPEAEGSQVLGKAASRPATRPLVFPPQTRSCHRSQQDPQTLGGQVDSESPLVQPALHVDQTSFTNSCESE